MPNQPENKKCSPLLCLEKSCVHNHKGINKMVKNVCVIVPDGWPCMIEDCRPGFFIYDNDLCFMSEYNGEAYCDSGEHFVKEKIEVQPVKYEYLPKLNI